MDSSQLKWLKNVRPDKGWAYEIHEMPIREARIFSLHWRNQDDEVNAQQPLKGDLIALIQQARVTHIVELLDGVVYRSAETEWGIYRVVKAVWMPREGIDWWNLPHLRDIFGVDHLPPSGLVYRVPTDGMLHSQLWKDVEGLPGFQQRLSNVLASIS